VFPAPIRQTLGTSDYESAKKVSFGYSGKKITRQSFGILGKVRELDSVVTSMSIDRVFEVHPEVSFWAMASGVPNQFGKHKSIGKAERRELLTEVFDEVVVDECEEELPARSIAAVDDLYDALAALWTAQRIKYGRSRSFPEEPRFDARGLPMRIGY
jgi:predicted RNase H-like nuclease